MARLEFGAPTVVNRRARYDYEITETFEAGIQLLGSEVKAIRQGHVSLNEAFAIERNGEIVLLGANITPYGPANRFNHEAKRARTLLLKKREIGKITGALTRERMTLVPLRLYFTERGFIKCEVGLAKGKKNIDKRATERERDWARQKARVVRGDE
jgi:SsrA-binding protein